LRYQVCQAEEFDTKDERNAEDVRRGAAAAAAAAAADDNDDDDTAATGAAASNNTADTPCKIMNRNRTKLIHIPSPYHQFLPAPSSQPPQRFRFAGSSRSGSQRRSTKQRRQLCITDCAVVAEYGKSSGGDEEEFVFGKQGPRDVGQQHKCEVVG
jgi:hypothetical protein